MFRLVAALGLSLVVGLAGCSQGVHNNLIPSVSTVTKAPASGSIIPMSQVEQPNADGSGCPAPLIMNSDGNCVNAISYCGVMCQFSTECDMVCAAWGGLFDSDPFGGPNFNTGGVGGGVLDYCSDPNNASDPLCGVATTTPTNDAQCDGSPVHLGTSNLPGGTNGWGTTVTNIFGLQNSGGEVYGWLYQNAHQDLFFQRNADDTTAMIGAFRDALNSIPGFGDIAGVVDAMVGSTTNPYQLTAQQATNIQFDLNRSGFKVHHCFNSQLPPPPPVG